MCCQVQLFSQLFPGSLAIDWKATLCIQLWSIMQWFMFCFSCVLVRSFIFVAAMTLIQVFDMQLSKFAERWIIQRPWPLTVENGSNLGVFIITQDTSNRLLNTLMEFHQLCNVVLCLWNKIISATLIFCYCTINQCVYAEYFLPTPGCINPINKINFQS